MESRMSNGNLFESFSKDELLLICEYLSIPDRFQLSKTSKVLFSQLWMRPTPHHTIPQWISQLSTKYSFHTSVKTQLPVASPFRNNNNTSVPSYNSVHTLQPYSYLCSSDGRLFVCILYSCESRESSVLLWSVLTSKLSVIPIPNSPPNQFHSQLPILSCSLHKIVLCGSNPDAFHGFPLPDFFHIKDSLPRFSSVYVFNLNPEFFSASSSQHESNQPVLSAHSCIESQKMSSVAMSQNESMLAASELDSIRILVYKLRNKSQEMQHFEELEADFILERDSEVRDSTISGMIFVMDDNYLICHLEHQRYLNASNYSLWNVSSKQCIRRFTSNSLQDLVEVNYRGRRLDSLQALRSDSWIPEVTNELWNSICKLLRNQHVELGEYFERNGHSGLLEFFLNGGRPYGISSQRLSMNSEYTICVDQKGKSIGVYMISRNAAQNSRHWIPIGNEYQMRTQHSVLNSQNRAQNSPVVVRAQTLARGAGWATLLTVNGGGALDPLSGTHVGSRRSSCVTISIQNLIPLKI
uniref:Uncharacterized protein n=1 Tax=Timspurckia oligopyrenoides TaxID=708627 RepID=A0A7S1ETF4_9RHOD